MRGDFAFLRNHFRRNLLARNGVRMSRRDLQRDVAHELLEFFLARRLRLARADFDQHADFRAGVDVSRDESVAGNFRCADAARF